MQRPELNRRDFHRLTMAAFGGVIAGAATGCSKTPTDTPAETGDAAGQPSGATDPATADGGDPDDKSPSTAYLAVEPHVCRGLNTCHNMGKSGENACAGQGTCYTANKHDCHYQNDCKGQGGCTPIAGQNACKELGNCAVPLSDTTWQEVRKVFEQVMADAGKQVGAAPAAE